MCASVFFFRRLGNKCSGNEFTCSPLSATSDPDADDDADVGDSLDDKDDEKGFLAADIMSSPALPCLLSRSRC